MKKGHQPWSWQWNHYGSLMLTLNIFGTLFDWEKFIKNVSLEKSNKAWRKTLEGKQMPQFHKTLEVGVLLLKVIN